MNKYTFKGCVYPRRLNINFKFERNSVNFWDINVKGKLSASFFGNTFVSHFETTDSFHNAGFQYLGCIGSCIKGALLASISDLAFRYGVGIMLDVEYFVDHETGKDIHLPYEVKAISDKYKDNLELVEKIHNLYNGRYESWYVQKFLEDFNYAMIFPGETGFFCYRAIESLAAFFKKTKDFQVNTNVWEAFRNALGVSKEEIFNVKYFSDPSRHGGTRVILTDEKAEIFKITASIFEKFVEFLETKSSDVVSALERT